MCLGASIDTAVSRKTGKKVWCTWTIRDTGSSIDGKNASVSSYPSVSRGQLLRQAPTPTLQPPLRAPRPHKGPLWPFFKRPPLRLLLRRQAILRPHITCSHDSQHPHRTLPWATPHFCRPQATRVSRKKLFMQAGQASLWKMEKRKKRKGTMKLSSAPPLGREVRRSAPQ